RGVKAEPDREGARPLTAGPDRRPARGPVSRPGAIIPNGMPVRDQRAQMPAQHGLHVNITKILRQFKSFKLTFSLTSGSDSFILPRWIAERPSVKPEGSPSQAQAEACNAAVARKIGSSRPPDSEGRNLASRPCRTTIVVESASLDLDEGWNSGGRSPVRIAP